MVHLHHGLLMHLHTYIGVSTKYLGTDLPSPSTCITADGDGHPPSINNGVWCSMNGDGGGVNVER